METFHTLFGSLLLFAYHCFDRIVVQLIDVAGRRYTSHGQYPHFFYRFLTIAISWQIAF
jgi:hypothetical protein